MSCSAWREHIISPFIQSCRLNKVTKDKSKSVNIKMLAEANYCYIAYSFEQRNAVRMQSLTQTTLSNRLNVLASSHFTHITGR